MAQNLFLNFLMVDLRDVFVPHDMMPAMGISNALYDTKFQMSTYVKKICLQVQYYTVRELLILILIAYMIWKLFMVNFRDQLVSDDLRPPI